MPLLKNISLPMSASLLCTYFSQKSFSLILQVNVRGIVAERRWGALWLVRVADPFSGSNRNHCRTAEMAFIGLLWAGYGTMIRSILANAVQLKNQTAGWIGQPVAESRFLFITNLNMFRCFSPDKALSHREHHRHSTATRPTHLEQEYSIKHE